MYPPGVGFSVASVVSSEAPVEREILSRWDADDEEGHEEHQARRHAHCGSQTDAWSRDATFSERRLPLDVRGQAHPGNKRGFHIE